jgi:hypothetical protein
MGYLNIDKLDEKLLDTKIEYVFTITDSDLSIDMHGTLFNKRRIREIEKELSSKIIPQIICEFLETDHEDIVKFKDDPDSPLEIHIISLENSKALLNIRYSNNKTPVVRIVAMLYGALNYIKNIKRD